MPWPSPGWLLAGAFVLLVAAGLLLHLGVRALEFEEPRRALVALEMGIRGDLVVPTTNGEAYLNKPPLFSWLLLLVMRATGSTGELWIRLPTVVSLLLTALLLHRVARRHLDPGTAFASAAFFLTYGTLLFYGSLQADIDPFFSLLVTAQALSVFVLEQRDRPLALFLLSYLFTALGLLAKGLPAALFQGFTLLAWLGAAGRLRWLVSWRHLAGLGVTAGLVGGYLALYAGRAELSPFLVNLLAESTLRTGTTEAGWHARLLLHLASFPLDLLQLLAPWTLFAGSFLLPGFRARVRREPFLRFCALFVAVNALPYWLSPGTRPRYLFPLLPFASPLLAAAAGHLDPRGRYARVVRGLLGVTLAVAALASPIVPFIGPGRFLRQPVLWAVCCAAMAGLATAYWLRPGLRAGLLVVLLGLGLARVQYDLVVPFLRRADSEDTFYRGVAETLNREHPGEPVLVGARLGTLERRIPFVRRPLVLPIREWFDTSLSFYYTAGRGQLLRYAEGEPPGALLLVHPGHPLHRPHLLLRTFEPPFRGEENLWLVRVLE